MSVPAVDIFLGSPSFTVFWITAIMTVAVVSILYRGGGANNRGRKQLQFKASSGRSQLLKNDRLSVLPDDILINILSFLTMKEAGRTSVLSKTWRHLWAYIPTLHFDSSKLIHEFQRRTKSPQEETPRYMHWVDQVVSSYKGPTIDEFRIRFDMRYLENSSCSIDNSIRFALEKKVKRLEVDFSCYTGATQPLRHTFNCSFLSLCNNLTSLELGCINITGEMLESVLCNCQTLEYLSVHRSSTLLSLKVTGRSLSLKALRIYYCTDIKQLEISAPNLVSVCYAGPKINVDFRSGMPKLAEVSLGFDYANDLVKGFSDISGYHSQIESLSLSPTEYLKDIRISVEGSVFTRLGKLVLNVDAEWDDDLNCLELLLKACPVLHHFKLELTLYEEDSNKERGGLEKLKAYPHYYLKVVEIVGFCGYPIDLEIAAFLIESAVSLEKIHFDSRVVRLIGTAFEFDELPKRKHAREQARCLHTKLKPGIKLEIF